MMSVVKEMDYVTELIEYVQIQIFPFATSVDGTDLFGSDANNELYNAIHMMMHITFNSNEMRHTDLM